MLRYLLMPVLLAALCAPAAAQVRPFEPIPDAVPALEGRPDAPADATGLLGPEFESRAAGLAFRLPAGARQVRPQGEQVVQFVTDRDWVLHLVRRTPSQPLPLTGYHDAAGNFRPGIMEMAVEQVRAATPAADFVRQDVVNIRDGDVGMLAWRHTSLTQRRLTQQAIIHADDQLYYVLTLSTPTSRARAQAEDEVPDEAEPSEDPNERLAVETFRQVLDSVRLLDLAAIKAEQDERLFRTRALFVSFTPERVKSILIPEQWLRILVQGQDVGYSYIVEESETLLESAQNPYEGVRIGIRSRMLPQDRQQMDTESWLFSSLDRRQEDWSTITVLDTGDGEPDHLTEIGASSRRISRVLDPTLRGGEVNDLRQPPVRQTETYTLNVTYVGKRETQDPVSRDLPPFYLPQAYGHLLPRLLPLHDPKTYLFASYSSEARQVMLRYVDVEHEREVNLGGRRMRAVPIKDRLGMDGSITTHYMSPGGTYLGSVNEDARLVILPTDAQTLQSIWDDAQLTPPDPVERPDLTDR